VVIDNSQILNQLDLLFKISLVEMKNGTLLKNSRMLKKFAALLISLLTGSVLVAASLVVVCYWAFLLALMWRACNDRRPTLGSSCSPFCCRL
jgi:hypothetical protein